MKQLSSAACADEIGFSFDPLWHSERSYPLIFAVDVLARGSLASVARELRDKLLSLVLMDLTALALPGNLVFGP